MLALRAVAGSFGSAAEARRLLTAAARPTGFPATLLLQRTLVTPPQQWYFLDTEGNLSHSPKRRRYYNPDDRIERGPGEFSLENVESLLQRLNSDLPLKGMPDPYKQARQKCVLCKYDVDVNYKNSRLLSQFVSRFTGKMYDRQTTGLCRYQSERVIAAIRMARVAGFMPRIYTEPIFYHDPKLFDPFRPARKS